MSCTDRILNNELNRNATLFLGAYLLNAVLIGMASLLYNGPFNIFIDPLSAIGMAATIDGAPNHTATLVYSAAMLLSGMIMAVLVVRMRRLPHERLERWLFVICGLGFFIAGLSPDDTRHSTHVLGSALVIAILWIVATTAVQAARRPVLQVVLQGFILAYALTYFFNLDPANAIIQKCALIVLACALITTPDRLPEGERSGRAGLEP